ncbi:hypothetical protein [Bacteroides ihuae]|uniref:hypothetical protein n=1 Tax=Bacteroides ihuae TaxID=1852362 RepID=UPI0008D91F1E|nr:hypothetical protein [Bacteroides ihuae]
MARIRTIKPEFWEDEKIGSLPMPCRLFFIGLWNFADDQGVFRATPILLKSKIFPYDENLRVSELSKWLDALEKARMIIPIIHEGESYYIIRTFHSHQILDKRYMKFIIPQDIVSHTLNTTCTHGEHIVNTTQEEEEEKEDKESNPNGLPKKDELSLTNAEKVDYVALMDCFNQMFNGKLPSISSMIDKRKKAVKMRAAEHGKQSIMAVFKNTLQSQFLLGHNDNNWRCDFDWIFRPTNYVKILEGNYNGTRLSKNQRDSQQRKFDSITAISTTVREAAAKKRAELEAEGIINKIP